MRGFGAAFDEVVLKEGGYSNRPSDRGGATRYGITEVVARSYGYTGDMRDLPIGVAHDIYKRGYWDTLRLDEIETMSVSVAFELFDTGVNNGIATAGKFLQRCLNAFNREGKDYADMKVDGVVGPMTVAAFRSYMNFRGGAGETVMLRALNALQAERYIEIAERDRTQEDYVFGWIANRVGGA